MMRFVTWWEFWIASCLLLLLPLCLVWVTDQKMAIKCSTKMTTTVERVRWMLIVYQ